MKTVSRIIWPNPTVARLVLPVLVALSLLSRVGAAPIDSDGPFRLPTRDFAPLPGKVIGVLASNYQSVLSNEGRKGPADALAFGAGNGSLRWIYLQDQKKPLIGGMRIPVGTDGKQKQRFNRLNLATLPALKEAGITEPFTLVEVEVNGGAGCPDTELFVATAIRPIEGSKRYPLRVTRVVDQLQQHHQKWIASQKSAIEGALTAQRQKLSFYPRQGTTRSEQQLLYVTWIPEDQVLQVQIRSRLQEKDPLPGSSPKPDASTPWDGTPPEKTLTRVIGVETGMGYVITRFGEVIRKDAIPVEGFHRFQAEQEIKRIAAK